MAQPMDLEGASHISVGPHHAEAAMAQPMDLDCAIAAQLSETSQPTLMDCRQILLNAAAIAESSTLREHFEALLRMLPDMYEQPNKPRLRELSTLLGVPKKVQGKTLPLDQLFRSVQKAFFACINEQRCDASVCGDPHSAAHDGTGAVSNEGQQHLRGVALPAFDAQVLQRVQKLGHYPKEMKNPTSDEDKRETKLAHLIRSAWDNLQKGTQSQLNEIREKDDEYPWISEIRKKWISICPRVPDDLMPRAGAVLINLWVLGKARSVEDLMKHFKGTKLWKDAGIVLKVTIPPACRTEPGFSGPMRRSMSAKEMHYNLGCVAFQDAESLLLDLEKYYDSSEADGDLPHQWQQYHMTWRWLNDAQGYIQECLEEKGEGGEESWKKHCASMERFLADHPGPPSKYENITLMTCEAFMVYNSLPSADRELVWARSS